MCPRPAFPALLRLLLRYGCALTSRLRASVQACWGGWHGVAVTEDGEAYAWGGNENLQTGATDAASEYLPLPARILPELRVTQVSAGGMHSLALTDTGDVWGWGQPLTTWGASADTNVYARQRSPMRVEGAANVVRIAAGAFHNLALTASGHVLAWGNSDYGQLGLGSTTHVATPHVVDELSKAGVTALAAGGWHSAALTAGGVVYVWGRGEHGRLGLGDAWRDRLRPVELPLAARAAHVTLGGTHSCVLTEDGVLYSFGRVSFGRLGRGPSSGSANEPNPVELPLPPANCRWRVEAVSAGGRHTLALARAVPANVPAAAEGGVAVAGAPAPALSVLTSASPMRRVASGSSLAGSARASLSFSPPPSPQPDHAGGAR